MIEITFLIEEVDHNHCRLFPDFLTLVEVHLVVQLNVLVLLISNVEKISKSQTISS